MLSLREGTPSLQKRGLALLSHRIGISLSEKHHWTWLKERNTLGLCTSSLSLIKFSPIAFFVDEHSRESPTERSLSPRLVFERKEFFALKTRALGLWGSASVKIMVYDNENEQVAQTLQHLNLGQKHNTDRAASRVGIYASWIALLLMTTCFLSVVLYLIDADRKAEIVRLQQSTELLAQSIESRLLSTSELLQRTSLRLMQIPGTGQRLASSDMAAAGFLQDRREVVGLELVNRRFEVLGTWASTSHSEDVLDQAHSLVGSTELRRNIETAFFRDAPLVTRPYTLDPHNTVFVDIIVPTAIPDQLMIARVNLSRLLGDEADIMGHSRYTFTLSREGKPLLVAQEDASDEDSLLGAGVSYSTQIPIFNDPQLSLESVSYDHELFTINNLKLWMILALACLLGLSLTLLLRYQRLQHRAHQRLSAEYALRVAMSESSVAGVRVSDMDGKILFVNDTFQRLTGFTHEDLMGATIPYPYWDKDITLLARAAMTNPDDRSARTMEVSVRRKDGSVFDGQMNISPLLNERGQAIGWIGELYDITEQKRSRERMKAAHERFTRVVQSMNSAICVVSLNTPEPQLLFRNTPYENIFGRGPAGAQRLYELIRHQPLVISRQDVFDETTKKWFDARMQPMVWTDDMPAMMIIATDITQLRETELALENQLRQAETTQRLVTVGEMASSLAHELNQPLAAISNYATGASYMIGAGKLSQEDTLTALEKINKQAQRAASIIKRIRGFAKKTDPQLTSVSPETIVSETMELAILQANKLKTEIHVNVTPNLPNMVGDAVMLEQLLLNLLKNAMEAGQGFANPTIDLDVGLNEDSSMVQFRVIDHGPGISDENKTKLFDAFFSTKAEGMGMGLNICRSIVEIHHGRIIVTDTPGGGATFTFTIPVVHETDEVI